MVCSLPFIAFLLVVPLPDMHFHIKAFNQSHFSHNLLPGRVKVKGICLGGGLHNRFCKPFTQKISVDDVASTNQILSWRHQSLLAGFSNVSYSHPLIA